MNAKYIKRSLVSVFREVVGQGARLSPIKTSRFGYPNKITQSAPWLKPAGPLPSYVKSLKILPERPMRDVPPPKRIRNSDPILWEPHYRWKPNQRHVVTLENAQVCRSLTIVAPDHTILWELSILWNVDPVRHPLIRYPVLPASRRLQGRALFLSVDMSGNYFHWMLDLLPKLTVLEEAGLGISEFDHYLVGSVKAEFQRTTLQRWGIPLKKVLETDSIANIEAEFLVVPSWADQSSYYEGSDMRRLRDALLTPELNENGNFPKKIFISRRKSLARNIKNWPEFSRLLEKSGVQSVELESLSFGDQVRLFQQAEVVVAMHGAGLTNLLFCQPSTKVLEFVNPDWPFWMYWNLASSLNLDYHYLVGDPVPFRRHLFQEKEAERRLQDLIIDTDSVQKALEAWDCFV